MNHVAVHSCHAFILKPYNSFEKIVRIICSSLFKKVKLREDSKCNIKVCVCVKASMLGTFYIEMLKSLMEC